MLVTAFLERIMLTNSAAGNSISIAVTDTGKYSDSVLGFSGEIRMRGIPVLLSALKNVVLVSVGTDHVLGLARRGDIYVWAMVSKSNSGNISSRMPASMGSPLASLASLSVRSSTLLMSPITPIVLILIPTAIQDLKGYKIVQKSTGEHRPVTMTEGGDFLISGHLNSGKLGLGPETLMAEKVVSDTSGKPRYLSTAQVALSIKYPFIGCSACHISPPPGAEAPIGLSVPKRPVRPSFA
ncbi:hypothetical protein HOY82DRAFT_639466 [Tuber indicum]|nr:hypothetical protein HOY82DRAFT_639466 [Tuber indicum]